MIRKPPKNIDVLHLKETLETHVAPPTFLSPFTKEDTWVKKDVTMIWSSSQISPICIFQWVHSIDFGGSEHEEA